MKTEHWHSLDDPDVQNVVNSFAEDCGHSQGIKRKRDEEDDDHMHTTDLLDTPRRKRIKSTSKYIYETLFLNSQHSDIKILALDKEWNLHKLYLKQAGYFSKMFSGSWVETDQQVITLNIPDDNIDESSLYIAFGSLYKDDIFIKPSQVAGVLAAASFLQLEGLIQQCVVMMKDTMQSSTVCLNLSASEIYGLTDVAKLCIEWLLTNLVTRISVQLLKDISSDVLCTILSSANLLVVRVETDVYCMLRKWLFLRASPMWDGDDKDIVESSANFFKHEYEKNHLCFLETEAGQQFLPIFNSVRWNYIFNDITSLNILKADKIIPSKWIEPIIAFSWKQMLSVEQSLDPGPCDISDDLFLKHCSRNGRFLEADIDYCWRWVGYSYGLDLLITYSKSSKIFTLKRNCLRQMSPYSVSVHPVRFVCYRLTVFKLDENGKILHRQSTSIRNKCFLKDEECEIMQMSDDFSFPFYVGFNVLTVTPSEDKPCPKLAVEPHDITTTQTQTDLSGATNNLVD